MLMIWIVAAVADRVTRPIVKLTAAAAAVEAGDYRPNGLGNIASQHNEFGQLARGFRRMVEVVSAREQQLRQAQESLARSERHYRALIENSMDIISVIEPDGAIRYESPSILRILGYDSGELAGRKVQDFVHPDDRSLMADTVREMMESRGAERTTEYRFRHKDGTWRHPGGQVHEPRRRPGRPRHRRQQPRHYRAEAERGRDHPAQRQPRSPRSPPNR